MKVKEAVEKLKKEHLEAIQQIEKKFYTQNQENRGSIQDFLANVEFSVKEKLKSLPGSLDQTSSEK